MSEPDDSDQGRRSRAPSGQPPPPRSLPDVDPNSRKLMGFSQEAIAREPLDLRAFRHPVKWTAWRLRVRRDGPSAAPYDGGPAGRTGLVLAVGIAVLAFTGACLIIAFGS